MTVRTEDLRNLFKSLLVGSKKLICLTRFRVPSAMLITCLHISMPELAMTCVRVIARPDHRHVLPSLGILSSVRTSISSKLCTLARAFQISILGHYP